MKGSEKQIKWGEESKRKFDLAVDYIIAARDSGRDEADPLPGIDVKRIQETIQIEDASIWIDLLGRHPGIELPQSDADCNPIEITAKSIQRWMDDDIQRVGSRAKDILSIMVSSIKSN